MTATGFAGLEEVEPDILPAVKAAQAFLRDYGLQVLATERTVWSQEHRVAGTIDLIAADGAGALHIIDWKRSKGLYPEHAYQLAAYGIHVPACR